MTTKDNIILIQIVNDGSVSRFLEITPAFEDTDKNQYLTIDKDNNISWSSIDNSLNILSNNRLLGTNIYYDNGRIGIGRSPLFNYRMDLAIPKDSLMTAFHIGDGKYGFSLGNGAHTGFIPEIIGVGSGENDTGLYFVGIAGNDISSNIPLIVIDGRSTYGTKLKNRPIFGITSGEYDNYVIEVDFNGNLITKHDIILENKSLKETIKSLQSQIDEIKNSLMK